VYGFGVAASPHARLIIQRALPLLDQRPRTGGCQGQSAASGQFRGLQVSAAPLNPISLNKE
jgi:hypothetical protein